MPEIDDAIEKGENVFYYVVLIVSISFISFHKFLVSFNLLYCTEQREIFYSHKKKDWAGQ